jgi:hypothetical protein
VVSDIGKNKFVAISFLMLVNVGVFVHYEFLFKEWFD